MEKYYAGIGSRSTPKEVLNLFESLGRYLAACNFTLRSGAADGADSAFERGCDKFLGKKEIYLPWKEFNNSDSKLIVKDPEAFKIAANYHPNWNRLSDGAKKLQARNTHQVLGCNLHTPCEFIICYTKNGKRSGGTGQALRLADAYHIPIFDVGAYDSINEFRIDFWNYLRTNYADSIEKE